MISKGNTHKNGVRLANYMTTGKDGERAELWQLRGFEATNIRDAFRDVQIMAGATRCEHPFFHVQVRNREGETLTRHQWEQAADRIEGMLGLSDQPRAIAFHIDEKTGHQHMHIAWSRIDEDTLTAKQLPFFKERLKKISRELEMQFALEPVTNHRKGNIKFAPTRAEDEQARRLGLDPHALRNTIRECWDRSDCGKSFQAALEHEGMILAKGDRNDFVVIDREGGVHGLGKRILDHTASKIRARLSDLSRDDLPTVAMTQAFIRELGREEKKEGLRAKPEAAWDRDLADQKWQDAVINAAIEKEKAERKFVEPDQRKERAGSREKEITREAPRPEPARASLKEQFREEGVKAAGTKRRGRPSAGRVARTAIDMAARTIGKTLDVAADAFASFVAPTLTPQQIREGERTKERREAEAESTIDFTRYTADLAQQKQQEQEREASRQRERGGRER